MESAVRNFCFPTSTQSLISIGVLEVDDNVSKRLNYWEAASFCKLRRESAKLIKAPSSSPRSKARRAWPCNWSTSWIHLSGNSLPTTNRLSKCSKHVALVLSISNYILRTNKQIPTYNLMFQFVQNIPESKWQWSFPTWNFCRVQGTGWYASATSRKVSTAPRHRSSAVERWPFGIDALYLRSSCSISCSILFHLLRLDLFSHQNHFKQTIL